MALSMLPYLHRNTAPPVPPRFHLFSQLPLEVRDQIWHHAWASGTSEPGVQFFGVCKRSLHPTTATGNHPRAFCRAGSHKSIWTAADCAGEEELYLEPRSVFEGARSSYVETYGILNACRESRAAALWYAKFPQGDSHVGFYHDSRSLDATTPSYITVDVARDLVCLLPHWMGCSAWDGTATQYECHILNNLRLEKPGHDAVIPRLAMMWHRYMMTGREDEPVAPGHFNRHMTFHPFILQMLAHLKRETFAEADYPAGVVNDFTNANGSFEVNHGFNGHFKFKGKFYLIDDTIKLKDPSKLAVLERLRKPEFVCGRKKYYKVARNDGFFDVRRDRDVFTTLEDLERDLLKHEYGNVPLNMPSWGMLNPMNFYEGTIGCSLYVLAVVE